MREQVTGQLTRIKVVFQEPEPQGFGPGSGFGQGGDFGQGLPPMFAQHLDPATGENEFAGAPGSSYDADHASGSFGGGGPAAGYAAERLSADGAVLERDPDDPATWGKVGRNEVCPCGSGMKYKHCHRRVST